jgi:hypothetical protein
MHGKAYLASLGPVAPAIAAQAPSTVPGIVTTTVTPPVPVTAR